MSSTILGYQEHYHCNSLSDAYRLINEAGPFTTLNLRTVCVCFIFSSCLLSHVHVEGRELLIETSCPFDRWLKRKKEIPGESIIISAGRSFKSLGLGTPAQCSTVIQIAALRGMGGHKTATVQRLKKHMQQPKYHSLRYRGTPTNTTNNYILLATTLKNK